MAHDDRIIIKPKDSLVWGRYSGRRQRPLYKFDVMFQTILRRIEEWARDNPGPFPATLTGDHACPSVTSFDLPTSSPHSSPASWVRLILAFAHRRCMERVWDSASSSGGLPFFGCLDRSAPGHNRWTPPSALCAAGPTSPRYESLHNVRNR